MRSKVAIIKCTAYEIEKVYASIKKGMDLLGGLRKFVSPGANVLLKVNLIGAWEPSRAITTHPAIVEALCMLIQEVGARPMIGDSSGGSSYGKTAAALRICGMEEVAKRTGASLVNFDQAEVVNIQVGSRIICIAKPLLDADVVISVPKFKTHTGTFITGAVKNMFGSVPGGRKAEYHKTAPSMRDFSEVLVDVFSVVKPRLTVVDGVVGMEGNGPSAGNPKHVGALLLSADCVAADTMMALMCGIDPRIVDTVNIAARRRLGKGRLDEIEVLGSSLGEAKVPDFRPPVTALMMQNKWIPKAIMHYIYDRLPSITSPKPAVTKSKCVKCGICVKSCPVQAMKLMNDAPRINYETCISCFCCHELCPKSAFDIKMHWLWRVSNL